MKGIPKGRMLRRNITLLFLATHAVVDVTKK